MSNNGLAYWLPCPYGIRNIYQQFFVRILRTLLPLMPGRGRRALRYKSITMCEHTFLDRIIKTGRQNHQKRPFSRGCSAIFKKQDPFPAKFPRILEKGLFSRIRGQWHFPNIQPFPAFMFAFGNIEVSIFTTMQCLQLRQLRLT